MVILLFFIIPVCAVVAFPFVWTMFENRYFRRHPYGGKYTREKAEAKFRNRFAVSYAVLLAVTVAAFVYGIEVGPKRGYSAELATPISECEEGGAAEVCLDLARKHWNGVTGICVTSNGGSRYSSGASSSTPCRLLDPDQDKADHFAALACAAGHQDGCFFSQNWTRVPGAFRPDEISSYERLCNQGSFVACDFLSTITHAPAATPVLPPAELIHDACEAGESSACLHSLKLRLIDMYSAGAEGAARDYREMLNVKMEILTRATSGTLDHYEAQKLVEMDQIVQTFLTSFETQPTAGSMEELNARFLAVAAELEAVELPPLSLR